MRQKFKIPDLNAPRFYQRPHNLITEDFIERLVEKYPKYKGIQKRDIKSIVKTFNTNSWKEVIETRDGVRLPESVGSLFIGTCPPPKVQYNPDYNLLNKENIVASNKNWETDGNIAKIFFTSYSEKYKYRFREHWMFHPVRLFKRTVAQEYPKNWNMFHRVDPKKKLSDQFIKALNKDKFEARAKENLKTYNDLEL